MEKLAEKYSSVNSNAEIQIQQSDSSTGISSVSENLCDIGMISRELKSSEKSGEIKKKIIAKDGIAVIINKSNAIDDISSESVRKIYTGEITDWADLNPAD